MVALLEFGDAGGVVAVMTSRSSKTEEDVCAQRHLLPGRAPNCAKATRPSQPRCQHDLSRALPNDLRHN
jgi:hypothetical protein